jgi:hypothetical protein
MKPQKFSKKTNIIVGILVLLVGVYLGGYLVLKSKSGRANPLGEIAQNINQKGFQDDLDYDGLADWEEKIYQTNPLNPDTDGDGYLDGEEAATGHDPTKPAPNDKLNQEETDSTEPNQPFRPEPGNLTQMLSYILADQLKFEPPVLLNYQGQDVTSLGESIEQAMDEKVVEALQQAATGFLVEFIPAFQRKEIQFENTAGNDLAAIRHYAGQMMEKIDPIDSCCRPCDNIKTDAEIIQESIETKNFEQVNCLAKSYLEAYQEISKLAVPLDWLDIHKKILTGLWTLHKVYQHLPYYEKDPLKGLLVMQKFDEANENFANLFQAMAADLENRE